MARPVDKKNFGPDAIRCIAKINGVTGEGYIVKQTATREFLVDLDGERSKCSLTTKAKADLVDGEMIIYLVNEYGDAVPVEVLKGRSAKTGDGKVAVWNTDGTSEAPVAISTSEKPITEETVLEITTAANALLNARFLKPAPSTDMLFSSGNPGNMFSKATDGRLEVAVMAGFYRAKNETLLVDGISYIVQLEGNSFAPNGTTQIKHDWIYRFSIGLVDNPAGKLITDMYDVKINYFKDGASIGVSTLVHKDGRYVIESPYGDIVDSLTALDGDVIQNIQRTSFIDPSYVAGQYQIIVEATAKGKGEKMEAIANVTVLPPVAPPPPPLPPEEPEVPGDSEEPVTP